MLNKVLRLLRYDWPLHFILLVTNWLPDNVVFINLRGRLASLFLGSCGKRLGLGRNITFYNPRKIHIGSDVYIAKGCWSSAASDIEIKDEVLFGPYVCVVSANHTFLNKSYRYGNPDCAPIVIGKGSWIGAHSTVLKGISIGDGSLIGSNSVVTRDTKVFSVNAGVPAKEIRLYED